MRVREHYERAFAWYLRENRVPYIAVNEARRALLPDNAPLHVLVESETRARSLKNFDFVAYTSETNYLIDVKGRKVKSAGLAPGRLESWVTQQDVDALSIWESLFRSRDQDAATGFLGAFVFVYWLLAPPPDGLFQEVFVHEDRWYALRSVELRDYVSRMKSRSPRWGTVDLSRRDFEALSRPFFGLRAPSIAATPLAE